MWSDKESSHDFLGYNAYVDVLCSICTNLAIAPLTVGIFGPWGSGKTSLMHMLKARLDASADVKAVKTLWFNAWRYEGRDEAQSALIHAIIAKLEEDKTLGQDVRATLKKLKSSASVLKLAKVVTKTALTLSPDIEGFFSAFEGGSEKISDTVERFDQDFAEALKQVQITHLVVFIDDLDRCSSAKVIETFETIKLFLNTPICTFVIGADAQKIEDAVGEIYGVSDGTRQRDFLEKIIQIPFVIPEQRIEDIVCYVGMLLLSQHVGVASWKELASARTLFLNAPDGLEKAIEQWPGQNAALFVDLPATKRDLEEVMPYVRSLFHALRGNPRQIKRFLNILSLRRKLAETNNLHIRVELLIKLGVVEYAWNEFFKTIVDTVDPFSGFSELFDEIAKANDVNVKAPDTVPASVQEVMTQPALVEYLQREPRITGKDDLRPYLFLAQTSLSRGRPEKSTVDDQARRLARAVGSEDRIRARAAARQAAALESEMAALIMRILAIDLSTATSVTVRTHIVSGMTEICRRHPTHYAVALKALEQTPSDSEAVNIAGHTLIGNAAGAKVPVTPELRQKFSPKTKMAAALATAKKSTPKGVQ